MSDQVAVTVAICTHNRCDLLKQTLEGFTQLDAPEGARWELVVVDNDSTDDTRAVLDTFVGRLPIRVLMESRAGLSSARNRALRETTGDFILWTDDDVLVDRRWLAEFVAAVGRYPEAAAFGGPIEPWFLRPPNVDLLEAFPRLASGFCGLNHDLPAGPMPGGGPIYGANMGYNRRITAGVQFDPV